jgi:hypothetical protein
MRSLYFLIIICFFLINCSEKTNKTENNYETENVIEITSEIESKIEIISIKEETFPGGGIFYNTIINDDNVNIRALPSLTSKIITKLNRRNKIKVIGISSTTQFIDNFNGHWINIALEDDTIGWAFEKYVYLQNVFVTDINVDENGNGAYQLGDNSITFKVRSFKNDQIQYFIWDIKEENYHYSCVPGCYIYNGKTGMEKIWRFFCTVY